MLKKLLVLNMRNCKRLNSFPSKLEMVSLQILILSGCLKMEKLPEDVGRIKSLTKLHIDRTSITELPLFGQQESIQSRWWTPITAPFGLLSKRQHPQRSVSLAGLHMLKKLNFSYCNLVQVPDGLGGLSNLMNLNLEGNNLLEVPESIGGLSFLEELYLSGNNFTSLPGSLSQLSHLLRLDFHGCKKLEVLPELPSSLNIVNAYDCTSLCSITGSFKDPMSIGYSNCPKLFTNLAIDSQLSISETQCLDSSITSQGSTNRFSSFLQYAGIQNHICEFFRFPGSSIESMDILYHGNSIPEWFTNRSTENHVKVELPSDWCYDKFRGYGTCVVFKRKKTYDMIEYSIKNFDGASLRDDYSYYSEEFIEGKPIRINEPYVIWLHYRSNRGKWEEAKHFVTFCFEKNNEDIEVKECGARVVCDVDLQQDDVTNLSMLQDLPTLSQHGEACLSRLGKHIINWSW